MKLIISPTKKMIADTDVFLPKEMPRFLESTELLMAKLKELSFDERKKLWKTSDKLTAEAGELIDTWDGRKFLSPALFSYVGIQFQYMAPNTLEEKQLEYLQEHLRILSGLYGVLSPFDGICPYRLEMESHLPFEPTSLYKLWNDELYKAIVEGDDKEWIVNLASKEYSKAVKPFANPNKWIDVGFFEEHYGRLKEKATYAKMARGEMVRFAAESGADKPTDLKAFNRLNFKFCHELSTENKYTFVR